MSTSHGRGNLANTTNQLSTFDDNLEDQFDEDLNVPRMINIQQSKMLEPISAHVVDPMKMKIHHTHQSSIDDIARGSQRQYPGQPLQVASQHIPATQRVSHHPHDSQHLRTKLESQSTLRTQTSTTSSLIPSEDFLSLTTKMKENHKEIKRIENILYRNNTKKIVHTENMRDFEIKAKQIYGR